MKISTALDEWIEVSKITKHPNTVKMHYELLRKQYLEIVYNHRLSNFRQHHAEKFIKGLKEKGLSVVTINMRIERLNTFLNWAHSKHYLSNVPKISKLREHRKLPRILNDNDLYALLQHLQKHQEKANNDKWRRCIKLQERFLMVLIGTGARRSEVFYLRWDQIDCGRKIITVYNTEEFEVKEGKEKELVMPDFLAAYLWSERQQGLREKFLLDDGNGIRLYKNPISLSRAFSRHFQRMGWKGRQIKPLHGFRAKYIDALFNHLGIDLEVVRDLAHHSKTDVTRGYLSGTDVRQRKAAAQLNQDYQNLFEDVWNDPND